MKVIYIAGKYRGPTPWAVEQNIRAAEDVAAKVIRAGHMPLTPHKNTAHMEGLADDAFFLEGTMELLRRCDAVLCVSNWRDSVGARAEVEEARRLGLPVFGVGREFKRDVYQVVEGARILTDKDMTPLTMDAAVDNLCEWASASHDAVDRSSPPPGYGVFEFEGDDQTLWVFQRADEPPPDGYRGRRSTNRDKVIAWAWEHSDAWDRQTT